MFSFKWTVTKFLERSITNMFYEITISHLFCFIFIIHVVFFMNSTSIVRDLHTKL